MTLNSKLTELYILNLYRCQNCFKYKQPIEIWLLKIDRVAQKIKIIYKKSSFLHLKRLPLSQFLHQINVD